MSQEYNSMLEFHSHMCWVIFVDFKVWLGRVKLEFDLKRPKMTRSIRASILSVFYIKFCSVRLCTIINQSSSVF